MKKLLKGFALTSATLTLIVAGAAMFSAFEAHIVNVTARIENALTVDTTPIEFGTAFPQEYLTRDVSISLSQSFIDEGRVDDVEYTIKQKPKVKDPIASCTPGTTCDYNANPVSGDPYALIQPSTNPEGIEAWQYCEENLPLNAPYALTTDDLSLEYWHYCYLPLADDLSKHSSVTTDHSVDAFHHSYEWTQDGKSSLVAENVASGRLTKAGQVSLANWTIDLKVPCFVRECAQEASNPDNTVNDDIPGFYVPREFRMPTVLEHKVFGTDLWIEVTNISTSKTPPGQILGACGSLLTTTLPTGYEKFVDSYDYAQPDTTPSTAGNLADHRWVQVNLDQGTNADREGVWDMGTAQSSVWLVASIDHGPVPDEANETILYYGDSPSGPWTVATRIGEDNDGPSNWISDDHMGHWQFIGSHRYVRAISTQSNPTITAAQNLFSSDDTEIDAICAPATTQEQS